MNVEVHEFGFNLTDIPISSNHRCYRPPSWPPPADWIVSEDAQGKPLSRWIDCSWDFSPWAGRCLKLDFTGLRTKNQTLPLGDKNQYILRLLATWMMWGPQGDAVWRTLWHRFSRTRRIVALCDQNGIVASDLSRYPKLLEQVGKMFSKPDQRRATIVTLDRLLRAKDQLGFTLIDQAGIMTLRDVLPDPDEKDSEQTAYIPPRIWTYQVLRLEECLEDYMSHRKQVQDCFNFCLDAYAHNFGTLEAALIPTSRISCSRLPFTDQVKKNPGKLTGRVFHGPFHLTAKRFGIDKLLEKWVLPNSAKLSIRSLSAFLTLVQCSGRAHIANFTLQRIEEASALKADCLVFEVDPVVGRIAIICGETTKTDPDCDARWPTSPRIELAVEAMTLVAKLRMKCATANPNLHVNRSDQENPLLCHFAFEPWGPSRNSDFSTRPHAAGYQDVIQRFPRLFDPEILRITADDLVKSRMFTPNLDKGGKFKIGEVWPLAYHQLRRTGAVNMFASALLSDSSIQFLLKHKTLLQAIYYGRNHTRLRFNEDIEGITTEARYEVMAKQIEALVADRFVSPAGPLRKQELLVNLINVKDFKSLANAGMRGEVSFRETRLGGCTKRGSCEYGGIESVARCAGSDDSKPCVEAVYDRQKRPGAERELKSVEQQLRGVQLGSPRERAMKAERQALSNFLDATRD